MKKINFIYAALLISALVSCKQDVISLKDPATTTPVTPSKGNADFTTYVSIGNSLTAGYQAGALFTAGQQTSFPKILSTQFSLAQGTTLAFNQPDINSVNGYNSSYSDPAHGIILGRLVLYTKTGVLADAVPTPAGYPGVPAPYNTADLIGPYTGDKTKLNNYGVPGIILAQCLTPATGGPAASNPAYNPYFARFAVTPSTDGTTGSSIISDVLARNPTFFTFDLGNNDVLGYAVSGGDGSVPITDQTKFAAYYQNAIGLLMANTTAKGVIANIPYVSTLPYFKAVSYNPIPLDAATASQLMSASGFGGYNQVMQGVAGALTANPGAFNLTAQQAAPIIAQIGTRLISFTESSNNAIVITDETLVDMGPFFDGLLKAGQITQAQRDALKPYQQIRQTTSSDLITLTAGAVIGTEVGGNPLLVNGLSVPLGDKYVLIPSEQSAIKDAIDGFNATIKGVADANATRLALADVNATFTSFVTNGALISDGILITPDFVPPTGAFSEDGVHPNSRGYAFMANIFIDAINTKFSAVVPHASLADYSGVGLPLTPSN